MGYCSNFDVQIRSKKKFSISAFLKSLNKIIHEDITNWYGFDTNYDGIYGKDNNLYFYPIKDNSNSFDFSISDMKWYDCNENLQMVSKEFPELKIFVARTGESSFDYEETIIYNETIISKPIQIIFPDWNDIETNQIFKSSRPDIY